MADASPYAVEVENLGRRFGEVIALDRVTLAIRRGEFFSLLGPSGCGKTTLLRIVAGLEVADTGTMRLGGRPADDWPAHRRPVNTVFQSYALFPHLDVRDNVAFGLRMKKVPRPDLERRVSDVMALVEIGDLAERRPSQLSGGQKQRVALARAIVNEPEVLLLDEPLAALDLKLRKQLQAELRRLQRRLGITFIYVTHDQEEALALSDRIAVMRGGRVEQLDEARALYERPRTRFVSQFLGSCSLLEASAETGDAGFFVARTALGPLRVAGPPPAKATFTLAIRPERIRLVTDASEAGENAVRVRIEQAVYVGSETRFELVARGQVLKAEALNDDRRGSELIPGREVTACLPPSALKVLDD